MGAWSADDLLARARDPPRRRIRLGGPTDSGPPVGTVHRRSTECRVHGRTRSAGARHPHSRRGDDVDRRLSARAATRGGRDRCRPHPCAGSRHTFNPRDLNQVLGEKRPAQRSGQWWRPSYRAGLHRRQEKSRANSSRRSSTCARGPDPSARSRPSSGRDLAPRPSTPSRFPRRTPPAGMAIDVEPP